MRLLILILFTMTLLANINAHADTQPKKSTASKASKTKKCLFPKSRKRAPDWICTSMDDKLTIAAVGSSAKSDAGLEFMEQMATAEARVNLAQKLSSSAQNKITEHTSDDQDKVLIGKITDQTLQGSKVLKKAFDPKGRLYVLIGFDEAGTQKLLNAISAEYQLQKRK